MAAKVGTSKPGFASIDPEKLKEIARQGGLMTQRLGKGHTFTPEEAREAGQKGGLAISRDRAHMAEIGRKGGLNSGEQRAKAKDHTEKEG
jgi:general stress protein YciG